ncbi:MAG: vanillic acid non-oxidative decarboxylation protein [Oscillospiraceae bacterium]|nr:vanillic acid non-oxidative decarboxylation protein [Oscillospiraceae bacterium]
MTCPRCDSENVRIMVTAPVDNAWEVYLCEKCHYSWRSTEDIHISEKFKLTDEKIDAMGVIPPVPPLD